MALETYPPWVVLHVPHDATALPPGVRGQFVVGDDELQRELVRMTDHYTLALFKGNTDDAAVIRAPVSRLVVDVERFPDDADEPAAARGMGAIYAVGSQLTPLRRRLTAEERESLMHAHYHPHHARLEAAVNRAIEGFGRCLVLDCHSFPGVALPYERADHSAERPDICIGTDSFHTDPELADAFVSAFRRCGWTVHLNDPFAGAMVPASRYRRDSRVRAVMVEVNRRLYLHEADATPLPDFADTARLVSRCCAEALAAAS